jgi:hypothetical protein
MLNLLINLSNIFREGNKVSRYQHNFFYVTIVSDKALLLSSVFAHCVAKKENMTFLRNSSPPCEDVVHTMFDK